MIQPNQDILSVGKVEGDQAIFLVRSRLTLYISLSAILVVGFFGVRHSQWQGNTELHTVMEVIDTALALMVGVLALIRFYSKKENTFLLIGSGFLGTGFLDGYHAVVTSHFFEKILPSPPSSLIPWSWNASRTFLSLFMFLSWLVWLKEKKRDRGYLINERWLYVLVGGLTLFCFGFFSLIPLPDATYPNFFLGRPYELVSACFFLGALVGYLKKGQWKENNFEHWVVLSLIVGFWGQAFFMSSSNHLFDGMFDVAHLLKKVSYICVLVGLFISIFYFVKKAEKAAAEMQGLNQSLQNENLTRQEVERKLIQISETLKDQKMAALNMMQDSLEAQERLEKSSMDLQNKEKILLSLNEDLYEERERLRQETSERQQAQESLYAKTKELEKTNEELNRANDEVKSFAYIVSHDLRAPLINLKGFTGELRANLEQFSIFAKSFLADHEFGEIEKCLKIMDHDIPEALHFIDSSATRMDRLVAALLNLSRLGKKRLLFENINMNSLVEEVLNSLRHQLDKSRTYVDLKKLPTVVGDRVALTQIMGNLLSNAVNYLDPKRPGQLHISGGEQDESYFFKVQDNGRGIAEDDYEKVFQPFRRAGPQNIEGEGMGLSYVKTLVRRHGGTIQFDSRLDEGSTFSFTIAKKLKEGADDVD